MTSASLPTLLAALALSSGVALGDTPEVIAPVPAASSVAARDLPRFEGPAPPREIHPRTPPPGTFPGPPHAATPDALAGNPFLSALSSGAAPVFEGLVSQGGAPPDPWSAVGLDHVVQVVNGTRVGVWDRSGNPLRAPFSMGALFPAGACATSSVGDPVALYDALAGRWLLAQMFGPRERGPFGLCVAVSKTADPLGSWFAYEMPLPEFPDFFKIGVWPGAYLVGTNTATYTVYALDRARMLAGNAAGAVRFATGSNFQMPAHVSGGVPPPDGSPGVFYTFKDDAYPPHQGGADRLELSELQVDFANPSAATFTTVQAIPVSAFTYTVCGYFVLDCIPQGGVAQRLDPVSEWPTGLLQYRRVDTGERFAGCFTVDAGNRRAGIRWFELARTRSAWALVQEGTVAPPADTRHRWVGGAALDARGGLALAYSASSAGEAPSLRFATRAAGDPPGTLRAEGVLAAGGGVQTGSNRWGDYGSLSVDPDGCTFWATGEIYGATSATGWSTRIGAFRIPGCGDGAATGLWVLPPCRALDTRVASPVPAQGDATYALAACGQPADAVALSANVTVPAPLAAGAVALFPAGETAPLPSAVPFSAGRTRANNAILRLPADGSWRLTVRNSSSSPVDVVVDLNGFFR